MVTIGIDLGTTNSLVAVFEEDGPRLLPNSLGEYLTPSVVGVADDGKTMLVGRAAQRRLVRHPDQTKALFKRLMGSGKEVKLGKKYFTPTDLSALVLGSLKQDAEAALGQPVTNAVISVPAYFNAVQRQATKDAAEIAGLKVERLVNEPTAAALANGILDREGESTFVVLDLGGGTFDVSILEMFDGVMEVRSSSGDAFLGGEDFTAVLAQHFAKQIDLDWKVASAGTHERLLDVAERLKRSLEVKESNSISTEIEGKEHRFQLTAAQFEEITSHLLARLHRPIEKSLYDAKMNAEQIDRVILVGGATRMAVVRSLAARVFRKLPERKIDPDHAIALGAAVQAGLVSKHTGLDDVVMTDVAPFSMGIETRDENFGNVINGAFSPLIERNTILPASRSNIYTTIRNNQTYIQLKVYQGEAAIARDNVLIGQFDVTVPPNKAGHEAIDVRFTYDVSGLLAIDVKVLSNNKIVSTVIDNLAGAMSDSEKASRLREMEKIKISPREDAKNVALMEAIKHYYEMLLGDDRIFMMQLLGRFESALDTQDPRKIDTERQEIQSIIDQIEENYAR